MSALLVRLATPRDADAIAELHAASWQTTYRGAMRDAYLDGDVVGERRTLWHERLTTPAAHQHVLVAEADGRVNGFACAYAADDATWGTQLDNLHVRRDAHGRGTGTRLIAELAERNRATHPGVGLYLWVVDDNRPARRFYAHLGARDAGGDFWHPPDGSALAVRRYVWPATALAGLATAPRITIAAAVTPGDYAIARDLGEEYAAWLGEDLSFQGFGAELDALAVTYGPPSGRLFLARDAGVAVACAAVRRIGADTCEMKRLFVREAARGLGIGRRLVGATIDAGVELGGRRMVLDTLERMAPARRLYAAFGFSETAAYYANPLPGVRYMALQL
ncbi:MAG: GNAT family N-acetyltransferase [Candidatus Binatia bacterium]